MFLRRDRINNVSPEERLQMYNLLLINPAVLRNEVPYSLLKITVSQDDKALFIRSRVT